MPISGSLEIKGQAVRNYFDNLLPDNGRIRARIRRRFGLRSDEIFDLLQAIGRDCVGAVQLLPDDASPEGWNRIECERLYSIHLDRGDAYRMTRLYDVLSMWPHFGNGANQFRHRKAGLAMAVRSKNAHDQLHTIQARHWHQLAAKYGGDTVWGAMLGLVSRVDSALAKLEQRLPKEFPARTWDSVSTGMRSEAKRFLAEAELLTPG